MKDNPLPSQQPIDLDALAAIVAKRTPGEWEAVGSSSIIAGDTSAFHFEWINNGLHSEHDASAIVAAVNAIEPLIERCRRAEAEVIDRGKKLVEEVAKIAELTRQRDELLASRADNRPEFDRTLFPAKCPRCGSVKGGADGKR